MRFHRESREDEYDVIVIGAGLGGLSAGALLAHQGKKVLVVERHDRPGGYAHAFKRKRYVFDSAVHLIGGCGAGPYRGSGLIAHVLDVLGVRESCNFLRVDPFYAALFPDFRLDAPLGLDAFTDAYLRQFPREASGFRDLMGVCSRLRDETMRAPSVPSVTQIVRRSREFPTLLAYHRATLGQVMDEHLEDPKAKAAFGALWPYLGLPPSRVSFLYWAMMLLSYVEDGAWYCEGSFQKLATALSQALTQHGGELQLKSVVRRLTIENGSVRGVVLENGQSIAAPVVISNADAKQTFEELAGLEHLPARFVRNLRAMRPSVSAFVVYAATSLDLRGAGACHEMFAYDLHDHDADYANLLRGEITRVGITVPTLSDPGLAPPGEHLVALTVLLPQSLSKSWRAEKEHYTELLLSKAERVFPGFRDHLRFAEGSTPRTLERYTRNFAGAMYGWELTPGQTGPLRLDIETPIAGLYLAGHWTQPGSGVYGVVASGVRAAQAVLGFAQEPDFWAAIEGRDPGTRPATAARSASAAPI